MSDDDDGPARLSADIAAFRAELEEASRLAFGFGGAMSQALDEAIGKGRELDEVLKGLGLRLARLAIEAAMRPLGEGLGTAIAGALVAAAPASATSVRSAPAMAAPAMTAASAPAAGPAPASAATRSLEPAGLLASPGPSRPVSVTVNVSTPDIDGFRRSRGQVGAEIVRALERALRHR